MFEHLTNSVDIDYKHNIDLIQKITNEMCNIGKNDGNSARFEWFLNIFASTTVRAEFYKVTIIFNSRNIPSF